MATTISSPRTGFTVAYLLGHLGWAVPSGAVGTLVPALLAAQQAGDKVGAFATMTALGALGSVAGVPALLVAGGRDAVAPPPNHALLASLLPEAEQYIDPYAGHGVAFRDPAGFAGRVASFLERVRD